MEAAALLDHVCIIHCDAAPRRLRYLRNDTRVIRSSEVGFRRVSRSGVAGR